MESVNTRDVSAIVCSKNSISGIEQCLRSLRRAEVGQIIVVDASSTDGTTEVAQKLADLVLTDPGTGLGNARNIGIAHSTGAYVLNMGSDNVMPTGQLNIMLETLIEGEYHGVSAQTKVHGDSYTAKGLNVWRAGKFPSGPRTVIGTPTLFLGNMLREHPYDSTRRFSDDSELCERWTRQFGSSFAISNAICFEVGKVSWKEIGVRATMYGESDHEVFTYGREVQRWGFSRALKSFLHPMKTDFIEPITFDQGILEKVTAIPFLTVFTSLRYAGWMRASWMKNRD